MKKYIIVILLIMFNIHLLNADIGKVYIKNVDVSKYPKVSIDYKAFDKEGKRLCDLSSIEYLELITKSIIAPDEIVDQKSCVIIPNNNCDCIVDCPPCNTDCIKISLILDVSESMAKPYTEGTNVTRLDYVKSVLPKLINNMIIPPSELGIVTFDLQVVDNIPLSNNKEKILTELEKLTIGKINGSKFLDAIDQGLNSLSNSNCKNAIILITDGDADNPTDMNTLINNYINKFGNKVKFYGIDIHDVTGYTETFLKRLSNETGGFFTKIKRMEGDPITNLINELGVIIDDIQENESCNIVCDLDPMCIDSLEFIIRAKGANELDAKDSITIDVPDNRTPVISINSCPDFKDVTKGDTKIATLVLENKLDYSISINEINILGSCDGIKLVDTQFPISIPKNSTRSINVSWTPTKLGNLTCCLDVVYAKETCSVICCMEGNSEDPDIRIEYSSDITQTVNLQDDDCFAETTVKITNTSGITMNFTGFDINSGDDSKIAFSLINLPTLPISLPTGESKTLDLKFKPYRIGLNTDILNLTYNTSGGNYNLEYLLVGLGTKAIAEIEITTENGNNDINFGKILDCKDSVQQVCVKNIATTICDTLLIIPTISILNDTFNEFTLWKNQECTEPLLPLLDTIKLDGQEKFESNNFCFYVKFNPNDIPGVRNADIAILSNTIENGSMPDYKPELNMSLITLSGYVYNLDYSFESGSPIIFDKIAPSSLPLNFTITILDSPGDFPYSDNFYWIKDSTAFLNPYGTASEMTAISNNFSFDAEKCLISMSFDGGELDKSYNVWFYFIDPCGNLDSLEIRYIMETSAFVVLGIPELTGENGQIIDVPIQIIDQKGLEGSNVKTFNTKIKFNTSILVPQLPEHNFTRINGDLFGEIQLNNLPKPENEPYIGKTLVIIPCRVTLGNTANSILELYDSGSDSEYVTVEDSSGHFRILDICEEGDTVRLFNFFGFNDYISAFPSPANYEICFNYNIVNDGNITLYISDMYGNFMKNNNSEYILNNEAYRKGEYTKCINVSNYPNGSYLGILITENGIYSVKFEVIK